MLRITVLCEKIKVLMQYCNDANIWTDAFTII